MDHDPSSRSTSQVPLMEQLTMVDQNRANHLFVERIKSALKNDHCTIQALELDGGQTLHIRVNFYLKTDDLSVVLSKVESVYETMASDLSETKELLVIVEDGDNSLFFDPLARQPT